MKNATEHPCPDLTTPEPLDGGLLTSSKEALALNAMSSLAEEFASRPDFDRLVELMLLTVSGQFAVTSAFVYVRLGHGKERGVYVGSGKFRNDHELDEIVRTHGCAMLPEDDVTLLTDVPEEHEESKSAAILWERKVRVLVPLRIQQRVIGLIGLSDKVTRKSYSEAETDLLLWLVRSITPLLVNARLFAEIDSLKSWYADLLNSIQQGVFVFDRSCRLKMMNLAALRLLENIRRCPITTNEQRALTAEEIFPAREFPHWSERIRNLPAESSGTLGQPLIAVSSDRERVFNVRFAFSGGGEKDDSDIIFSLDDVTDQKNTESRLFDLEKLAERGMMASSIAHELNNYLGMVLGGVEMSQLNFSHGKQEKAEANLDKTKEHILKMQRFTAGLTDQHRLDPEPHPAQLADVVNDVLSFVQIQKRFRNVSINCNLPPDLPKFEMDVDQMAQLLLNLLNNAADAILETGRRDGRIEVSVCASEDSVILAVTDNGKGIPPDVQQRLFHEHLTTKESGHGYGLVTCHRIMENHRACVAIDSEVGRGSRFTVTFPTSTYPLSL